MHIGNIRLPNVFEKGPVTVKMPKCIVNGCQLVPPVRTICFSLSVLVPPPPPPPHWKNLSYVACHFPTGNRDILYLSEAEIENVAFMIKLSTHFILEIHFL